MHPAQFRGSGWLSDRVRSGAPLIYVSDENVNAVLVYEQAGRHQQPVGEIVTGVDGPDGLFLDRHNTLYVANVKAKTVTAYAQGQLAPQTTYSIGLHDPIGVTVGTDGTVYVSDFDGSGSNGSIVEYPPGSTLPALTLRGFQAVGPGFSALDAHNSLFVANGGFPREVLSNVLEFAPHSTHRRFTGITVSLNAGGMTFDALGALLLVDQRTPVPAIYIYPPSSKDPKNVITAGFTAPFQIAFNAAHTALYATDPGSHSVVVFSYPADDVINTISAGLDVPLGVALTP